VVRVTTETEPHAAAAEKDVDMVPLDYAPAEIGVIGGSGLYQLGMLTDPQTIEISTPYGSPSGPITIGELAGRRVAFLPRHGVGHRLGPSQLPARANIYALRRLGVREVVAVSAVGSLSEKIAPGDLVVPDQIVDRTHGLRPASFFGDGLVVHVGMADPFCPRLREPLLTAARQGEATVHDSVTYLCMEGPQFSTRAESELHRSWGLGIVGMTALPEAKLAREAELCYVSLALVTDYDCWHDRHEDVTATLVAEVMSRNVAAAGAVLERLVPRLDGGEGCPCQHALEGAVLTDPAVVTPEVRAKVALFLSGRS
jgi:5'-methylthioadenosine phosphorylase